MIALRCLCLRAVVLFQRFVRVVLRQDTVCDDGGPGAFFVARCALGTDCADCGGRTMPPPPPRPPLDPGSYLREDGVVLLIDASPSPSPEPANPMCRNTCQYAQVCWPVALRVHAATALQSSAAEAARSTLVARSPRAVRSPRCGSCSSTVH
eukprot:2322878-Prymnesium_polylepis.2